MVVSGAVLEACVEEGTEDMNSVTVFLCQQLIIQVPEREGGEGRRTARCEGGGEEELCAGQCNGCLIGHGLDLMVVVISCHQEND